jgi:hypothetical protein
MKLRVSPMAQSTTTLLWRRMELGHIKSQPAADETTLRSIGVPPQPAWAGR